MIDLHTHLLGHMDRTATEATVRVFLDQARAQGLREIGFSDHDYYEHAFNFDVIRMVARDYPDLKVRCGLEAEYRAGDEARIAALIGRHTLDYVIGSVHEMDGWAFDSYDQEEEHRGRKKDETYRAYFRLVEKAAASGLFQIIGHLDLIKLFGMRPESDVRDLAAPALEAIARAGLCVEINTNGRNKPVGEFYPEDKLVEEIARRGILFTLGSDAHDGSRVGADLGEAAALLRSCGVQEVYGFARKQKIRYALSGLLAPPGFLL